jgi:hypothetical protein
MSIYAIVGRFLFGLFPLLASLLVKEDRAPLAPAPALLAGHSAEQQQLPQAVNMLRCYDAKMLRSRFHRRPYPTSPRQFTSSQQAAS